MLHFLLYPLILLTSLIGSIDNSQINNYQIKVAGIKVGQMNAIKIVKENFTYYSTKSESNIWLGKSINIKHETKCVYDKEKLISAEIIAKTTKGDFNSTIKWNKDHYDVNINNHDYQKQDKIYKPITFSVVRLYFEQPPDDLKEIFVEGYGMFSPLKELSPNYIQLEVPGKSRKFKYSDDTMIKAEMENPIKNFTIERK